LRVPRGRLIHAPTIFIDCQDRGGFRRDAFDAPKLRRNGACTKSDPQDASGLSRQTKRLI
jgi:hypothetical protein